MRIALVNPNTSARTTEAMRQIAGRAAAGIRVDGVTAPFGAPLITCPAALEDAGRAVLALAPRLARHDAVIVAAFGDPGLEALRGRLSVPVTGIAEAAMREAGRKERPFAVVTTTPDLRDVIAARAERGGHRFLGTWVTPGDPAALMEDRTALEEALLTACRDAVAAGAEAVIIGGGPLAEAARALAPRLPAPLIEPVPAAVRLIVARLEGEDRSSMPP